MTLDTHRRLQALVMGVLAVLTLALVASRRGAPAPQRWGAGVGAIIVGFLLAWSALTPTVRLTDDQRAALRRAYAPVRWVVLAFVLAVPVLLAVMLAGRGAPVGLGLALAALVVFTATMVRYGLKRR